jgi:hypothetical protein
MQIAFAPDHFYPQFRIFFVFTHGKLQATEAKIRCFLLRGGMQWALIYGK